MKIRIVKPGLLTTIQDLGRWAYLAQAVPVSGAMDTYSARLANKCIGNPDNDAVIEFTASGASFIAETDLLIAYTGGGAILEVNEQQLPPNRPLFVPVGSNITFTNSRNGFRTYLAIAGGWDLPLVLGSRSTYTIAGFGGHKGRSLQKQDILESSQNLTPLAEKIFLSLKTDHINYSSWHAGVPFRTLDNYTIRIMPGHEFGWFEGQSIATLLSTAYNINNRSNRMGCFLDGIQMKRRHQQELLSTAVTPGTIQVVNDGSLVLLMADAQTTGGYPRIAQIAAADLPLCGQLKPGDAIKFEEISFHDAETLYFEQENNIEMIGQAIAAKFR
ncbi:biotin-dependent carboxyltransferase family protein [Mucilaginibacter sp. RS28]|uniref:Biotin-dependent carboxyltransferase family protein n=1 Tax=Mucilaginibacter straminoryzae TaxID=2932774 RepID=A0A9X1XBP9_9SPHI|nr:biotin-dependent carboxyltransferase family protein [Mucilaginibacter straminoryzae]MCJ8211819.1 biotin-dependent carboxyltransferase family protein [Mucilaginibacter straminoryzae]